MSRWYTFLILMILAGACNGHPAGPEAAAKDSNEARFAKKNNRVVAATLERDAGFAVDAAVTGVQAVQLGRGAARYASEAIVRKLADSMTRQYAAANMALMRIAAAKNISMPAARQISGAWDQMRRFKGRAFDNRYLEKVKEMQEKDIERFKRYISTGSDSDLLYWAIIRLPLLQQDLVYVKLVDSMARQRQRTY